MRVRSNRWTQSLFKSENFMNCVFLRLSGHIMPTTVTWNMFVRTGWVQLSINRRLFVELFTSFLEREHLIVFTRQSKCRPVDVFSRFPGFTLNNWQPSEFESFLFCVCSFCYPLFRLITTSSGVITNHYRYLAVCELYEKWLECCWQTRLIVLLFSLAAIACDLLSLFLMSNADIDIFSYRVT